MNVAALTAAELTLLYASVKKATGALDALGKGQYRDAITDSALASAGFAAAATLAARELKSLAASASPNGMKGLDGAISQLAGTVGTLVLPGFAMLGAAIYTAADAVNEELKPQLENVAAWYVEQAGNFVAFAENLKSATLAVVEFGKKVADNWDFVKGAALGPFALLQGSGENAPGAQGGPGAGGGPGGGPGGFDIKGAFTENLSAIAKDMRAAQGQTGFSKIDQVFKQLQTQALQSQLEAKRQAMFDQAIRLLERIVGELQRPAGVVS